MMASGEATQSVRVGFIGCGGIAQGHLRALHEHPHANVVAVCDVNRQAAERAAERSGAEVYTAYQEMLEEGSLDAVYLCLPPFAHGEIELAVIERGLPFFVQKPVALDLATARRIATAARAKNLITCVGYQLRYYGATDVARAAITGHTVGVVNGYYWCGVGRGSRHWLVQRAKSGGQLVEQATHTLDMLRYLVGEIRSVYALQATRVLDEIDCPDVNALALQFENGAVGTFSATWVLDTSDWNLANVCEITYDDRRLRWSPGGVTLTEAGKSRDEKRPDESIDVAFIEAIRSGDRSLIRSDYDDAARTLALTLAADESARAGRPVDVVAFCGK
jgi:myo-inositol 2-dehydrogenase/D-chiro-inositol 1-dehydrogenase